MRQSRLDQPAHPMEHFEHADSPSFAAALTLAYEHLIRGAYDEAERLVTPFLNVPMSLSQRVRHWFIMASAAHHRWDHHRAIEFCEQALAICEAQDWHAEFAQLALLCAEAYHDRQLFGPAAAIADTGLSAWLTLRPPYDAQDRSFEVDLRDRLSLELFLLGHYAEALRQAMRAHRLTQGLPASRHSALRAAGLDWTIALLHRWRGDTRRARQHMLSALATYEGLGSPNDLVRARVVIADIALDALAPLGVGITHHYREDLIQLAQTNLALAVQDDQVSRADPTGRAMAQLAMVRFSRALGMNTERFSALEAVGHVANALHDLPLLGQVYLALGDEFGAAGQAEEASQLNCYRRALGVIEGSHAPAYGAWALRALLHAEENRGEP
jgi:tetratricopeptide (TPR) repeat protein